MSCLECANDSSVYVRQCPKCVARFCLTLPTKEAAKTMAQKWCSEYGHDFEQVQRIAQRIREERFSAAMRKPA